VLKTLVAYRLIDPGSEWRLHRQWHEQSAMGICSARTLRCRTVRLGAMAALDDGPRPGKTPEITDDAKAWLVSLTCQKAKDLGYPHELWTTGCWRAVSASTPPEPGVSACKMCKARSARSSLTMRRNRTRSATLSNGATRLEDRQTLIRDIVRACAGGAWFAPACNLAAIVAAPAALEDRQWSDAG
jgi:hypothetical protein